MAGTVVAAASPQSPMLDLPAAPRAAACTPSESTGRSIPLDVERGTAWYNEFHARGGWKYSYGWEYRWHRRHLVKRFRLRRGLTMLEVGCGNGFHTNLFNLMGFACTGVDRSIQGSAWARDQYPHWVFECCDLAAMPFEPESFDVVVSRGLILI